MGSPCCEGAGVWVAHEHLMDLHLVCVTSQCKVRSVLTFLISEKPKESYTKYTLGEESTCLQVCFLQVFLEWGNLEKNRGIIMCLLLLPVGSATLTVSTVFNTVYNSYFLEDNTQIRMPWRSGQPWAGWAGHTEAAACLGYSDRNFLESGTWSFHLM